MEESEFSVDRKSGRAEECLPTSQHIAGVCFLRDALRLGPDAARVLDTERWKQRVLRKVALRPRTVRIVDERCSIQ